MAKLTKSQIIEELKKIGKTLKLDVQAQAVIDYTVEMYQENPRNVSKGELEDVIDTVEDATGKKFADLVAEVNEDEETIAEAPKVEDKKVLPKKMTTTENSAKVLPKKAEDSKEVVKEEKPKMTEEKKEILEANKPHNDYLAKFPETLESKSLKATLKLRRDLVTIEDVANAFNNTEDIVIATYWTKKLLRQYAEGYDPMGVNPNRPKSFDNDLDLIELTYANNLVVTGCSLYSYVPQVFIPEYFEQDEDGMRYANGCEFEIYEIIEE